MHVPYRAADLVFMHEHGSCMRNDERVRAECACVFVWSRTFCSLASLTSASRMCVTSSGSLDERMCKIAFSCYSACVNRSHVTGRDDRFGNFSSLYSQRRKIRDRETHEKAEYSRLSGEQPRVYLNFRPCSETR